MAEKYKQLTEKDAEFVIQAVRHASGEAELAKLADFATVLAHFQQGLADGRYPKSSIWKCFFGHKPTQPEELPHLLEQSLISGERWRAFDPAKRGINRFEEAGVPFTQGLFRKRPMRGSKGLFDFYYGGSDPAFQFIDLKEPRKGLSYNDMGTEISIGKQIDLQGNTRLILMVFRDYYGVPSSQSDRRLEMLDKVLLSHEVAEETTDSFLGFDDLRKQNEPQVAYLRLRSAGLARSGSIEITRMKPLVPQ